MEEYIQVYTTTDKKEVGQKIAKALLEKRLAGCVQVIGPIVSAYWWNDKFTESEEWLCLIKSRGILYEQLEKCIKEIHPYETPEIVVTPIIAGSEDYLNWLYNELKKKK